MSIVRSGAAALIVSLAAVAAVSPTLAKERASRAGHNAQAQAFDLGAAQMTPEREKALRECSAIAARYVQKDWGVQQDEHMAACMLEHGQPQ